MITRQQLTTALGDGKTPFQTKGIDHHVTAINLLRSKIPYSDLDAIIWGADHEIIYLCDIHYALIYLDEEDLIILADCNVHITDDEDLAMFI